jgi:DNA gyrase subunit A
LADEEVWVMVGEKGTLGRAPGANLPAIARKPLEQPAVLLKASTLDVLYLVSAGGRAVGLPVHRLPESDELGKGTPMWTLTSLARDDYLAAAFVLPAGEVPEGYVFLTTLAGMVKRLRLDDLPGVTTDPFVIINVADNDSLGWARLTTGEQEILLATSSGQAIRFNEDSVRPMGLPAAGVFGIKIDSDTDGVIGMDVVTPNSFVWSITDNGLAKASPIDDYPLQNRYGQGVINLRLPKGSSEVVATTLLAKGATLIITTSGGVTKRIGLSDTTIGSRSVRPQSALTLAAKSRVTGAILPVVNGLPAKKEETPELKKKRIKTNKN